MSYNKPEIIAGDMQEKESFSCGCPTYSYCAASCQERG